MLARSDGESPFPARFAAVHSREARACLCDRARTREARCAPSSSWHFYLGHCGAVPWVQRSHRLRSVVCKLDIALRNREFVACSAARRSASARRRGACLAVARGGLRCGALSSADSLWARLSSWLATTRSLQFTARVAAASPVAAVRQAVAAARRAAAGAGGGTAGGGGAPSSDMASNCGVQNFMLNKMDTPDLIIIQDELGLDGRIAPTSTSGTHLEVGDDRARQSRASSPASPTSTGACGCSPVDDVCGVNRDAEVAPAAGTAAEITRR